MHVLTLISAYIHQLKLTFFVRGLILYQVLLYAKNLNIKYNVLHTQKHSASIGREYSRFIPSLQSKDIFLQL